MKKRLTRITPIRNGIVLCVLYGFLGLIALPFCLVAILASGRASLPEVILVILLPAFYAVTGFVAGLITAALYNVIAKWTGVIEFEVHDVQAVAA